MQEKVAQIAEEDPIPRLQFKQQNWGYRRAPRLRSPGWPDHSLKDLAGAWLRYRLTSSSTVE